MCAGALLHDPSSAGGRDGRLTEPSLEAWALALQLTEDEDDGVRREVTAALGAAVAADDGVPGAEQVSLRGRHLHVTGLAPCQRFSAPLKEALV